MLRRLAPPRKIPRVNVIIGAVPRSTRTRTGTGTKGRPRMSGMVHPPSGHPRLSGGASGVGIRLGRPRTSPWTSRMGPRLGHPRPSDGASGIGPRLGRPRTSDEASRIGPRLGRTRPSPGTFRMCPHLGRPRTSPWASRMSPEKFHRVSGIIPRLPLSISIPIVNVTIGAAHRRTRPGTNRPPKVHGIVFPPGRPRPSHGAPGPTITRRWRPRVTS